MGLDFIRKGTGNWHKKWKEGRDFFKHPDLFDRGFGEYEATVTASIKPQCGAKIGDTFVVEQRNNQLIVTQGLRQVGEIAVASEAVLSNVAKYGGIAAGQVKALSAYGTEIQLSIK
jgi:hypothetical protein